VDFIDMEDAGHRAEVFRRFEEELSRDRARTRILQISDFGLVEVTRQRTRGNLEKLLTRPCPDCEGSGRVKTDLTVALDLRRDLSRAGPLYMPGETVRVRVNPSLARLLGEEETTLVPEIEERLGIRLELLSDETLPPASYVLLDI
jgi:ribonuclease G